MLTQYSESQFRLDGRGNPGAAAELPVCGSVCGGCILQLCRLPGSRDPCLMWQRCLPRPGDQPGIFGRHSGVRRAFYRVNSSSCAPANSFGSANDGTGTGGYVGVDPVQKVIIVAFKGTDNGASFAYE